MRDVRAVYISKQLMQNIDSRAEHTPSLPSSDDLVSEPLDVEKCRPGLVPPNGRVSHQEGPKIL